LLMRVSDMVTGLSGILKAGALDTCCILGTELLAKSHAVMLTKMDVHRRKRRITFKTRRCRLPCTTCVMKCMPLYKVPYLAICGTTRST
jgi:hypothetical protein